MRIAILTLFSLVVLGCGRETALGTPAVPPVQTVAPTGILSGPVASYEPSGAQIVPWSSSLESSEFSLVVRYTVQACNPNSRLVELGGYDSLVGGGYGIEANSGGYLSCVIWDVTGHAPASVVATIPASGEHAVACVLGSGVLTMYLDGALVGTVPATYTYNLQEPLGLGTGSSGNWSYGGVISSVKIWNRVLSALEVSAL
jgi:hypothetical protein